MGEAVIGGAARSPSTAMPLGATRVLTISFALHFALLAWVLPARPRPVIEVFVPEASVEMVMAAEEPPAAETVEPAAESPAEAVPPATAEATAEPAPAEATATASDSPAEPPAPAALSPAPSPPTATRRPIQPRAVTTVVPRPVRPTPGPAPGGTGGGGAGGGGMGPATAAAPPVLPADYIAAVQAVLARGRRYPPEARARGVEGTAWVRFTIRRDGVVVAANVARSSGDPALDAATEDTAARAIMPPLPESWTAPTMTLVVPVSYALR